MSVIFVIGPAGVGKSTYIAEHFPEYKKVDLFDFQEDFMTVNRVWQSYLDCAEALKTALKENENVVLEHTLLKAHRRTMYIEAVREITDAPIDIYVILPDVKTTMERRIARGFGFISEKSTKEEIDMCDIPTKNDGFREIHVIRE